MTAALPIVANPCAACTIGQDCCSRLTGLRVTPAEYERCFASVADRLLVEREGPVLIVSDRGGGACPNWNGTGCSVYDDRPVECRLFPHTLYTRPRGDGKVLVLLHTDTRCPLKRMLLAADEATKALATQFAVEAFAAERVVVRNETRLEGWRRRMSGWASALRRNVRQRLERWVGRQSKI